MFCELTKCCEIILAHKIVPKLSYDRLWIRPQGPYAKHCRSCYFQTKIDLRRRSIYVGMQNAILTFTFELNLVGRPACSKF